MADWTTINGLEVPEATPTGAAGLVLKNNFELLADRAPNMSTSDPTTSDDADLGFVVGSRWLNTSSLKMWICTDNTVDAAIWKPLYRWDTSTNDVNFDSPIGVDGAIKRISSGSNAALVIKPKGTGALQSDDTGNARGIDAVDLQMVREADTQVASGLRAFLGCGASNTGSGSQCIVVGGYDNISSSSYSTIVGGSANVSSGAYSIVVGGHANEATTTYAVAVGGQENVASGTHAFIGSGYQNVSSGIVSAVLGGTGNTASGSYSAVTGGYGAVANKYGQHAQAGGFLSSAGDAQTSVFVARRVNTTDGWYPLYLDGSSARLTIPTDTTWAFRVLIAGRSEDSKSSAWQILGCIANNAGTTAIVGNTDTQDIGHDILVNWGVRATADNTNDALVIESNSNEPDVYWVARIELVEITY